MSQGTPKGKGGTVLMSNFTPPAGPTPGAPPPGAPPGPPPPDAGGWGAPPAAPPAGPGYGAPPDAAGGYGAPPGMAPPGMAPPAAAPMAPGGGVPDHVQGQKTKLLGLEQNLGAALGYFIGLLMLLYIFMEPKEHRFVRFHAFQCLFAMILYAINIVVATIPIIIAKVDPNLTEVAWAALVLALPLIPLGICMLIAVFKAFSGKAWKIPVIGGIAEKMAMK